MKALHRRLFIGLVADRRTQFAIQRHCRDWVWPTDARLTRFGRYHITLHFLGDVGVGYEERLKTALRKIVAPPLELELAIPEVWPNHVAALRPAAHDGLLALHQATGEAIAAAGLRYETEYKFAPHITLARQAALARPPQATRAIRWRVEEFQLVWAILPPEAKPARYEIVERFGLNAQQPPPPSAPSGQAGGQSPLFE